MKKSTIYAIVGSLILVVVLLALGANPSTGGNLTLAEGDLEWVKGNPDAKVELVEYLDFQCPACRSYSGMVNQLLLDFPEDLKVGYLHFPLTNIHANALPSALAAEAAGAQGKFWEMADLLFERQSDWSQTVTPAETFGQYAQQLGLDPVRFLSDFNSDAMKEKIISQQKTGLVMKLSGTPSFFLNGKKIENPRNYEEFHRLIEKAIDQ